MIAELILRLPFVSVTLASAALRHRGEGIFTLIGEGKCVGFFLASVFQSENSFSQELALPVEAFLDCLL